MLATLWITVGIIIFLGAIFYSGFNKNEFEFQEDPFITCVMGAVLAIGWPLFIMVAIAICPLYLLHKLGEKIRQYMDERSAE